MRRTLKLLATACACAWAAGTALAAGDAGVASAALHAEIDRLATAAAPSVIVDRRYVHQHPELGNRETGTADYVARRLRALGYEVHTGVAKTGVVGTLQGGRAGPVVALRAELDALPVTEDVDLPYRSTVRADYLGQETGVMHACGHDAHIAMLLGTAEVLAHLKSRIPGTVKLLFQPAEEGPPPGEEGGARLMIKEGVLSGSPKPSAIFGLHAMSSYETGIIAYRSGGIMAGSDDFRIVVHGRQTHGAMPWNGVDPIVVASQIVLGLQTVASRQMDVTKAPVVITVGKIEGGVKSNIIPDDVTLIGTIRALDPDMLKDAEARVLRTATDIAASAGATVDAIIEPDLHYAVTFNDPALTARMLPTLRRIAGDSKVVETAPLTSGEDFSAYQERIPGLFVFLGIRPKDVPAATFAANHSPKFRLDESAMTLGVRTLSTLAIDYLSEQR